VTANTGFKTLATVYPATTSGLRGPIRSVSSPEKSLANEETLSATPSISPSLAGPAPMVSRKAGSIQYAISVAVSLQKEVAPKT
jgi:hypothetical protein